jgi:hypothetical protein
MAAVRQSDAVRVVVRRAGRYFSMDEASAGVLVSYRKGQPPRSCKGGTLYVLRERHQLDCTCACPCVEDTTPSRACICASFSGSWQAGRPQPGGGGVVRGAPAAVVRSFVAIVQSYRLCCRRLQEEERRRHELGARQQLGHRGCSRRLRRWQSSSSSGRRRRRLLLWRVGVRVRNLKPGGPRGDDRASDDDSITVMIYGRCAAMEPARNRQSSSSPRSAKRRRIGFLEPQRMPAPRPRVERAARRHSWMEEGTLWFEEARLARIPSG